jgi:hypothetical protein
MTLGEERLLVIPANEGYGKDGRFSSQFLSFIPYFCVQCFCVHLDSCVCFAFLKKGFPAWGIPPGGTLEFTLECLDIQEGSQRSCVLS